MVEANGEDGCGKPFHDIGCIERERCRFTIGPSQTADSQLGPPKVPDDHKNDVREVSTLDRRKDGAARRS